MKKLLELGASLTGSKAKLGSIAIAAGTAATGLGGLGLLAISLGAVRLAELNNSQTVEVEERLTIKLPDGIEIEYESKRKIDNTTKNNEGA